MIPGIIAFNLYSDKMADIAANDPAIVMVNDEVLAKYDTVKADTSSLDVFMFDTGWMKTHPEKAQELSAYNEVIVARAEAAGSEPVENNLLGYKYDSALGLLIGNLIPRGTGLLGFILAALLGAIVSSLAAVLNASSTIFTMDIYSEHINKKATQFQLVTVGRVLCCHLCDYRLRGFSAAGQSEVRRYL